MVNFLDKTFGRLGNRMFQMAALWKYAKMNGGDVYFQDPRWFEGYEEEIKQIFKQEGESIDYVAIHVRRGDYVNNPFYVDLTKEGYYKTAFMYFNLDLTRFLIFSDDIEWCKKQTWPVRSEFSEGKSELEDFNLMTRCKHQIIANSSFSWWAAYLNSNPNKIIIAPSVQHWYADGVERTVCPPQWIRL